MKTAAGSETSRVSGNYHERKEPVVMVMASKSAMFLEPLVFIEIIRIEWASREKLRNKLNKSNGGSGI